jgi:hypothetical protein
LIKAKRDFDELDQLYKFQEKKFFVAGAHTGYKRYARANFFFLPESTFLA